MDGDAPPKEPPAPPAAAADEKRDRWPVSFDDVPVPPLLLMFPEYAIGQKVISRADYDAVRLQYKTQAQIAFGAVLALFILAAVILWRMGWREGRWPAGSIVAGAGFLGFLGFDRLHKYHAELQSLIAGNYRAILRAKVDEDAAAEQKKQQQEKQQQAAQDATKEALAALAKQLAAVQEAVDHRLSAPVTITNTVTGPPKP
jgi:hypothetical protein